MIKIDYELLTLEEAIYLLQGTDGYFNADRQQLILPDV